MQIEKHENEKKRNTDWDVQSDNGNGNENVLNTVGVAQRRNENVPNAPIGR